MKPSTRTSAKRKRRSPDPRAVALREDMARGAVDVARGACAACGGPLDNGAPVRLLFLSAPGGGGGPRAAADPPACAPAGADAGRAHGGGGVKMH